MRAFTSFTTRSAIMRSRSLSSRPRRNLADSPIERLHTSLIDIPPIFTASVEGFSRAPAQVGHGTSRMYDSMASRDQSDSVSE